MQRGCMFCGRVWLTAGLATREHDWTTMEVLAAGVLALPQRKLHANVLAADIRAQEGVTG